MNENLHHVRNKIIEQAPQLARVITESQQEKYPILKTFEQEMLPARVELVTLYANTLVIDNIERIGAIKTWGEKAGTHFANYESISLDMMLREVPHYRNTIGAVMKHEALEIGLSVEEMYDAITRLDNSVNDIVYFFSMPFVRHEKEMLKLSQSIVSELSVPIASINSKTAILPLVGNLSHDRAKALEERVLQEVLELQLENLIIDLSGLHTTDTYVTRQLFNLFDALSLLGVKPIVSGITPVIAQTLVNLGLTFGRIASFATLKQALASLE